MDTRSKNVIRILLYAEGDFSYCRALCQQLAEELRFTVKNYYEIVATDFAKHEDLELIQKSLLHLLVEKKVEKKLTISILDQVDATAEDKRISGQFDKIICNFPTPFNTERLEIEKMLSQIKKNNLLTSEGVVEIRFWVDDYAGKYEYAYRLARAQKKNGFQLKSREIVDLKKLKELGYNHNLHSGEKDAIDHLPIVSTFQLKNNASTNDDELSDSEVLRNDAMPARWANHWSGSEHQSEKLNIEGKGEQRWSWRLRMFKAKENEYTFEKIMDLIQYGNYREADRRLTVLIEAGDKRIINFASDERFHHWIEKKIDEAYEKSDKPKPTDENLKKFHQFQWYTKLKVLTGVNIPDLKRDYRWN